ncbi:MAG: hypothetical protein WDM91_13605 [Rhizomicrobium sp.]
MRAASADDRVRSRPGAHGRRAIGDLAFHTLEEELDHRELTISA